MKRISGRTLAVSLAMVAGLLVASPALSATSPGSIAITSPTRGEAASQTVTIRWAWRTGTSVRSTSFVDVQATINGVFWTTIASNKSIKLGSVDWNTVGWPDFPYGIRVVVRSTSVKSPVVSPIIVDNTAPTVTITRPQEGDVILDDQTMASFAVVAGSVTLESQAVDGLSGVNTVEWMLDDESIGQGASLLYDFGANPGQHTLTAVATDLAGNSASDSTSILALPGLGALSPITGLLDPSNPPPVDPEQYPVPVPSENPLPGEVPSPDLGEEPNPLPSEVPSPDTGGDPGANPAPSELPLPLPL